MRQLSLAILLIGILVPAAFGQQSPDEPSEEKLREWVSNLESDSYSARSVATERLIGAGGRAIKPVSDALEGRGLETMIRGIYILRQLALTADEVEIQDTAYNALKQVSNRRITTASRRALSAMVAINEVRRRRAQQYLEQLGAVISERQLQVDDFSRHLFPSVRLGKAWRGTIKDLDQLRWLTDKANPEAIKWLITFSGKQVSDEWLDPIAKLEHVAAIHVNSTSITDNGIAKLKSLPDLQFVELLYSPISNASIEHLRSLKSLTRVKFYGTDVTREAAKQFGEETLGVTVDFRKGGFLGIGCEDNPCRITQVRPQTAAAQAGLQFGDIITHYNGNAINTMDELTALIAENEAGEAVSLSVLRGPKRLKSEVVLGRWGEP